MAGGAVRRALAQAIAVCALAAGGVALARSAEPSATGTRAGAGTSQPAPAPIAVRDDRGVEHRFERPPARIVALLPSLTEVAWVLGAGDRLVGVDRYSDWPPAIAALPRLGGLDDARIEAIVALKPDVVLASTASRALDRLEALGLRVVRLRSESHADVRRSLGAVAALLGTPDDAERVWGRVAREIDAAAARVPPSLRGARVYFEIGGGPYAAGAASFIGETLARLGLGNAIPPELGPFPKLNPEFVVRAAPDLVMGLGRELDAMPRRPGWASLAAVRDRRTCGFDAAAYDLVTRPGPRLGEAAGRIADCLARLGAAAKP